MYVLAASGDVIRFDATTNTIADALKDLGDTDSLRLRRAKAIGILADPDYALAVIAAAREARAAGTTPADATGPAGPADPPRPAEPAADSAASARPTAPAPANPAPANPSHAHAESADPVGPSNSADPAGPVNSADAAGFADFANPSRPADATNSPAFAGPTATDDPAGLTDPTGAAQPGTPTNPGASADSDDSTDLGDWWAREPDDEADRDAPHPSTSDLPDPLDTPPRRPPTGHWNPTLNAIDADDDAEPMDAAARRALNATLANLNGIAPGTSLPNATGPEATGQDANGRGGSGRGKCGRAGAGMGGSVVYVHLTDQTLATGTGILRVENLGPLLADQLAELIGHRPYVVKPVIDLNRKISVDAYEIPARIRERIKLTYPVEQFPYGTAHTTSTTDLDHIQPYDPLGPPKQTSTTNLAPLRRFTHRLKTHGRWQVRRLDDGALEWTSPHQFTFRVDHTGTHPTRTPST
jgi:hypothetical protein